MKIRALVVIAAVLSTLGLFSNGCQSGGVGDPCIPEDEYQQTFAGYSHAEVNLESRSFQCETRVCLVNHFRGRVTCPLGQQDATCPLEDEEGAKLCKGKKDGTVVQRPGGCKIPGSDDAVAPAVKPQCTKRRATDTVYCSCRCAGPDPNAKYCECPSGYTCRELKEFEAGVIATGASGQLRGSYCVKSNIGGEEDAAHKPSDCDGEENPPFACTEADCGKNP